MIKLAIVIPAYKSKYLFQSLQSILEQTDKRYNVYIGNDNSPEDIDSIFSEFSPNKNFFYTKFKNNLGSISLVKQWQRCMLLTQQEEWIWLFSDDDIMDRNCVKNFYQFLENKPAANVVRFNLTTIDKNGSHTGVSVYPEQETPAQFLMNRLQYKYSSAVTNYIFKSRFILKYGFEDFPLAWCSDDAAVISCSETQPVVTLKGAMVYWRISDINISSAVEDEIISNQKAAARLMFVKWVLNQSNFASLRHRLKWMLMKWYEQSLKNDYALLNETDKKVLLDKAFKQANVSEFGYRWYLYREKLRSKIRLLLLSAKRRLLHFF